MTEIPETFMFEAGETVTVFSTTPHDVQVRREQHLVVLDRGMQGSASIDGGTQTKEGVVFTHGSQATLIDARGHHHAARVEIHLGIFRLEHTTAQKSISIIKEG